MCVTKTLIKLFVATF